MNFEWAREQAIQGKTVERRSGIGHKVTMRMDYMELTFETDDPREQHEHPNKMDFEAFDWCLKD